MSTVLPRPSRLPSNRPVGRPRPPTPAPVKRARSRSTSADSDIEIVEPSAAVVPLDKGKSRAGNDGAATDLAPGAPDVARRSTSGERGSIASGAGDETRGPGRPPRSLPRLAGTSSASAVASSSATTLEAPTLEKSQSTSRLPASAFFDRHSEPAARKSVAPSTDASSRPSSRAPSLASTSETSIDAVPPSAPLGRARKTVTRRRRASATVVPDTEDEDGGDDEGELVTHESRAVREKKSQRARQHAHAKARPGGVSSKRPEVKTAEKEYQKNFPLRVDARETVDLEDSFATSWHVKDYHIRIDELTIAHPSNSFPPTYDVTLTLHLTCPSLNPTLDLSPTRAPVGIESFHILKTSIIFERTEESRVNPRTRPDGQYEARYTPPTSASFLLSLDPTTIDPATLKSASCGLEVLVQVEYDGITWGFLRLLLPESRRGGRETLSIENTDAACEWRRVDGKVGAKQLAQEHGELEALARMVQTLDLSTRMRDPFPLARRMVERDKRDIFIPDLGPTRSIYHFLTRVPYTPGDLYEHSDEETPTTTNFLTRRQDSELFSEDPPLEPKSQIVVRLHQRFCAINPYPPRPFDRELACWTHYARQVDKYDLRREVYRHLRREVYRHLRQQKDLDLLTAMQQADVVEAMDGRVAELRVRREARRAGAKDLGSI